MNKLVKTSACLGSGGLIAGGGVAAKSYLSKEQEEHSTVLEDDEEKTLEDVFKASNLSLATELSDFITIFNDLKRLELPDWAKGIMDSSDISSGDVNTTPASMKSKCQEYLKKPYSEFTKVTGNDKRTKGEEFRTAKIVCTTNYSLIDNARDYWGDDKIIYSEKQSLDENKWKKEFEEFKAKPNNGSKTIEDMKAQCLTLGKGLYRTYDYHKPNGFYEFCVINDV